MTSSADKELDDEDDVPLQLQDAWATFAPRKDQPHRFDEQESFYNSKLKGVAFLVGGNGAGCLGAEQLIYDPVKCRSIPVSEISGPFHVLARDANGRAVIANASRPKIYGVEDLYRVELSNGQQVVATLGHKILTVDGWREIGNIARDAGLLSFPVACDDQESQDGSIVSRSSCDRSQVILRSDRSINHRYARDRSFPELATVAVLPLPVSSPEVQNSTLSITAIHFIRRDFYWDFSVDEHENYWLAGAWHHNTSECAVAKAAKFMLWDQIAPRKDTPFWCIAESYEQVCNTIWKEKLFGHGHIPFDDIDWERIRWFHPNQNWPFEVPLKPRPQSPGTNWTIKFKSYSQGRQQMQAESIGGFLFSEQFPWGILEEVVRGCREYSFRGGKLAEFTPVDPTLSVELEERIAQNRMPKGWKIFRANTTCAMEAGHVSRSWYDEFFGLIPEEMRLVREIGAFATFAGAIYPSLNPAIHFLPDEWEIPPACHHRRAIDWGFGPDNAFVCLWGCRDGSGRWYIYDEYWSTDQNYTIHDHLKEIADRWPWPIKHFYGCTYADPSDPGCIRIASEFSRFEDGYENFDIQGANNRVYEGIEHVRWLLKWQDSLNSPRLMIHKANCPNLARELRTYRWERGNDKGRNPRDARPVPLKNDDHAVDALRYLLFSEADKGGITAEVKRKERDSGRHGVHLERTRR